MRAADRLRQADLLIWTDSLVCPAILDSATILRIRTSHLTLEEGAPPDQRPANRATGRAPSRR